MRNNTAPEKPREATTNVLYKFSCQEGHCDGSNSYIGRTSSTLRRRLQFHRNQGSIFQHFTEIHNMRPPLQKLIDNTQIIHKENDFRKQQIAEAVSITIQRPSINIQQSADFILPSKRLQEHHAPREQASLRVPVLPAQPTNQRPGPVTRATSRLSRATTLSQDHRPPVSANQDAAPYLGSPPRGE